MPCSSRPSSARGLVFACVAAFTFAAPAAAQSGPTRRVQLSFTPTDRAQIAVWIESADGTRFQTIGLTESVALRGIGNRPGATQMNSGFRWPYGRREGALPVWAHRRVAAGADPFPRVIFNGRASEGNASSAGSVGEPRNTRDDYFCLSFMRGVSSRDALDAMTCPSVFMSNKGRYITDSDAADDYAEPWQRADGSGMMRPLPLHSFYPPRRDYTACDGTGCGDSESVSSYAADARRVMPEIDAVTMATPAGGRAQSITFEVPADWPEGDYVAFIEVNVEGDYNGHYDGTTNPTPTDPSGMWDYWALNYGYPYRGQPSVVFEAPFSLTSTGGQWSVSEPAGYGALQGEDGDIHDMDGTITDSPSGAPGSGADRLEMSEQGERLSVSVPAWNVCEQAHPPPECGQGCAAGDGTCGSSLILRAGRHLRRPLRRADGAGRDWRAHGRSLPRGQRLAPLGAAHLPRSGQPAAARPLRPAGRHPPHHR